MFVILRAGGKNVDFFYKIWGALSYKTFLHIIKFLYLHEIICGFPTIKIFRYYITDKTPSKIYFLKFNKKTYNNLFYRNVFIYVCHCGNIEVRKLNFINVLWSTWEISAYALIEISLSFKMNQRKKFSFNLRSICLTHKPTHMTKS